VNGIVDKVYPLTVSLAVGAVAAFAFTYGFHDGASRIPWQFLIPFSLPGALIAMPLSLVGLGNVHDPSPIVIALVDFFFYSFLAFKLLQRLERRRAK
jgi:hypothetical protein